MIRHHNRLGWDRNEKEKKKFSSNFGELRSRMSWLSWNFVIDNDIFFFFPFVFRLCGLVKYTFVSTCVRDFYKHRQEIEEFMRKLQKLNFLPVLKIKKSPDKSEGKTFSLAFVYTKVKKKLYWLSCLLECLDFREVHVAFLLCLL